MGSVLQRESTIGISWEKVGDLTGFSSRDDVREEMLVYPSNGLPHTL